MMAEEKKTPKQVKREEWLKKKIEAGAKK